MIVVSVFLWVHNPSAWKLNKFTSFWHLNVGMILIRQCVQTMLLLIIDFTPPLYYVLHLLFWGDTYDLVASFSSSCQCWFYWHGSRPQHRSALLVGRWFFFFYQGNINISGASAYPIFVQGVIHWIDFSTMKILFPILLSLLKLRSVP